MALAAQASPVLVGSSDFEELYLVGPPQVADANPAASLVESIPTADSSIPIHRLTDAEGDSLVAGGVDGVLAHAVTAM
jgi:hypothetical protein